VIPVRVSANKERTQRRDLMAVKPSRLLVAFTGRWLVVNQALVT